MKNYAYVYICPESIDLIWHCIPAWNALKKDSLAVVMPDQWKELFATLFPSIDFYGPKDEVTGDIRLVAAGKACMTRAKTASGMSPAYSPDDPPTDTVCHYAIRNLMNVQADVWTPDYTCEYKPQRVRVDKRTGLAPKDFINMVWSDTVTVDKYSWVCHLRALLGMPQVVVWPKDRSLYNERPMHKDTQISLADPGKPIRCAVFMLTHDIPTDMLDKAIDTTLAGIGKDDTLTIISSKATPEINALLKTKPVEVVYVSENLYLMSFNFAAESTNAEYVCFLNDDIISEPGWADALIGEMEKVGAKLGGFEMGGGIFRDDIKKFENVGWGRCGTRQYIDGWCVCSARQTFMELGGLSLWIWGKLLGAYAEDSDYSFKAKEAGHKLVVVNPPQIKHIRSCSKHGEAFTRNISHNNGYVYSRWKNLKATGYIIERWLSFRQHKVNLAKHGCLGDAVTGMAAAAWIASKSGKCQIVSEPFKDLMKAYSIPGVQVSDDDQGWQNYMSRIVDWHLVKGNANKHNNYVGVMVAAAGYDVDGYPPMVCPKLEPPDELKKAHYAVLQPASMTNAANDLSRSELVEVIRYVKDHYAMEIVVAGKPAPHTPTNIPGVRYCLGDAINYCRVMSGARLMLGSESAGAHIAAGYKVPMVMWVRKERREYMWLFDYPDWIKVICDNNKEAVIKAVKELP